jgi:hypothetical protein
VFRIEDQRHKVSILNRVEFINVRLSKEFANLIITERIAETARDLADSAGLQLARPGKVVFGIGFSNMQEDNVQKRIEVGDVSTDRAHFIRTPIESYCAQQLPEDVPGSKSSRLSSKASNAFLTSSRSSAAKTGASVH